MTADQLDAWLPAPRVRTHHRCTAAVAPDVLWRAAGEVRLRDTRTLGRLVRWRIPGVPEGQTFRGMLAEAPFVVLDEGERFSLSGLAGRIWSPMRDHTRLDGPEAFRAWDERDTVRVLFAHWIEEGARGRSALVSEARVAPVDRRAELRLRSLWVVIGTFERLIGGEALSVAAARAERRPVAA